VTIELLRPVAGVDTWSTVGTVVPGDYENNTRPTLLNTTNWLFVKRARITVVAGAALGRLSGIRYIPTRANNLERPHFLASSSASAVNVLAPELQVQQGTAIGSLKPNSVEIRSTTGSTRWRIQVNDLGVISTTQI
jgi:hypothetical protein